MRFHHEGFPEHLTILDHSEERTLVEVILGPGGGTPMHVHHSYAEWFEVLEGRLDIPLADRTVTLEAGEQFTAGAKVPHCFVNTSSEPVRFQVELRAGQRGFLEMQLLLFGLRADGLMREDGMPKDPRTIAVGFGWADTAPAERGPALMMRVLRVAARLTGVERRLREHYVVPAEHQIDRFARS